MKLDIACGQSKREGFTGVDIAKCDGVDVVHDLTVYPWPFEDNSVDEAFCSHYIEHVHDLFKFFDELYRILKPGAQVQIIAPYGKSDRAWQDPTHIRPILEATFLYANRGWREANKLNHYPISCNFDYSYGYQLNAPWNLKSQEALNFALCHYWNVASDIHVTMTKRE